MDTTTNPAGRPATTAGRWFSPAQPPEEARIRLFLMPHAGSGAAAYRGWSRLLPAEIGAQALTLPGRQSRRAEPLPADWEALLDDLHEAVLDTLDDDRPYAFFGHCIGAMFAYRLAVRLEADGDPPPSLLGMSGWSPKGFFQAPPGHEKLSMEEFSGLFQDLGAFPEELWNDPDMLDLVMPPVIADFRIAVQYEDDGAVVESPLVSYAGRSDPLLVEPGAMTAWTGRSRRYLGHQEYPGDHFYVGEHSAAVMSDFARRLMRIIDEG
ncbi:thioesterase domain-containing protein [Spirillospora sp. NPDC047279]|uniref:thioesterase II family protein n=1 Tax=Spirillospora sp. NPDC047279 TaxID=3155478 RepID=UPI0033E4D0AF